MKQLELEVDNILPQIYGQGINPKMYDVSLSITRSGNVYTTTYSLKIDKSDDGKAWTGFYSRGSAGGNDYIQRADGQIDGTNNKDGKSMKTRLEGIGAVDIIPISNSPIINTKSVGYKQYFFQFTKISKPSHDKTAEPTPNDTDDIIKNFVITTTKLDDLNPKFKDEVSKYIESEGNKNYSVDYFDLSSEDKINATAKLDIVPDEKGFNKFSILLNPKGESQESLNHALEKNPGSEVIKQGTIIKKNELKPEYEWHLVGLHV